MAARAGYTRGAIYAHYSGKEDLLLALIEHRVLAKFSAVRQLIEGEPEASKRAGLFKCWIASQVCDHSWGMLLLEFKLYALRRPRSREKLQHMYDLLLKSSGNDFIEILPGDDLDRASRAAAERSLAIMGAVLSAVILENRFRPKLLSKPHLRAVLEELYEVLIHA